MNDKKPSTDVNKAEDSSNKKEVQPVEKEIGGFENKPEPTRFGDWDVNGRCSDF